MHEESADKFARILRPVILPMTDINVDSHQLILIIGRMQTELHSFRSNDFIQRHNRFIARLSEGEPTATMTGDSSSSVFGELTTSAPPFDGPARLR